MKRFILVNGVPASGKSTVAQAIAQRGNWPLLALDTIKEALFAHLGTGDRDYNRLLGRASYQAMFDVAGAFPGPCTTVMDAWFGFQPLSVLQQHLERAGPAQVAQVWCTAPAETIGQRYLQRVGQRSGGHLGADYVPELIALARQAKPLPDVPTFTVDTTQPFEPDAVLRWLSAL